MFSECSDILMESIFKSRCESITGFCLAPFTNKAIKEPPPQIHAIHCITAHERGKPHKRSILSKKGVNALIHSPAVCNFSDMDLPVWSYCALLISLRASPGGFEPPLPAWKADVLGQARRWGHYYGPCKTWTCDSLLKRQILYQPELTAPEGYKNMKYYGYCQA